MDNIKIYKVSIDHSIRKAIKNMDEGGIGFCVCVDRFDKVIGVISDGDFRRAILKGVKLDESAEKIMNRNFVYLTKDYQNPEVEKIFSGGVAKHIPVLDDGNMIDIITEESFYVIKGKSRKLSLTNPVVIMAGGKGKRLDPFTRILPKPLIPLGEDPIIKVIMDMFGQYGMKDFYITLNDKGKMIKAYFHDHDLGYNLNFIEEGKMLGTAGSLKLLQKKLTTPFFVSNCDIIIKSNYSKIMDFHRERANTLTLVGSMQHHTIPYGVCDIKNGGDLLSIREKPEYDFLINTGLYILEPSILKLIPENTYFDMTDLIASIQEEGLKVGVFPVSEKAWIDVGQWTEYRNAIQRI
jgi:dTDP-glucose pyrophosphorylase